MVMTLTELVYFCAVVRSGSYSQAAEELGVSEPVVYRAVRTLEKVCGIPLLHRSQKRICATPDGSKLFKYASQIVSLVKLAEHALIDLKGDTLSEVHIGAGSSASSQLLSQILPQWMSEHPNAKVSIVGDQSRILQHLVLQDRLDMMFGWGNKWASGLRRQLVLSESLVVVSIPSHRFARYVRVSIDEVAQEKMILQSGDTSMRDEIESLEDQYDVRFRMVAEVNRADIARMLCEAGVALAVLPMACVRHDVETGIATVLSVEGFPREYPCFFAYRMGKTFTAEMRSLIHAIERWVQEKKRPALLNAASGQVARSQGS